MTNNAIAWALFQLRGGWRSALVTTAIYAGLILTLLALATRLDPRTLGRLGGWVTFLMFIQTLALVLFAGSRINAGVRTDLVSRMIESHRLMPVSPGAAIFGYLLGAAAPALCWVGANVLIGFGVCAAGGLSLDRWLLGNAVLLVFAAFVWTFVVLMAFTGSGAARSKGGVGWVAAVMMISFTSQGMITALLPALTVLASPLIGGSIYTTKAATGATGLSLAYAVSLAGQLAIGSMCFVAAGRKYRSDSAAGFTPGMAMVVLAAWVGLSVFGLCYWDDVQPAIFGMMRNANDELRIVQLVASLLMAMLVAILPLAASSRAYRDWRAQRELNDPSIGLRPLHPALAALLAAALCMCITYGAVEGPNRQSDTFVLHRLGLSDEAAALTVTAGVIVAFTFGCGYLLRLLHRGRVKRIALLTGVFVVLLWAVPMLVDVARHAATDDWNDAVLQTAAGFSPIGALVHAWGETRADPFPGVLGQLALAIAIAVLFHATSRRGARSPDQQPVLRAPPL